ncbi:3-hydroxyisobutyrate dehydrogenase [Cokeromyces recurvatus]|uniref:3-hydroxyisobutyrate dehydrogenase n=1 Tax=Cokeromyces recurvatus TaxID=90255 RepID=UPI00221F576B|nr:3-hydroxyisobutyrate dehydrogenase [Cokeromyces recurvatus]KAI7898212.1 3-hydroxyisobutyrate dehydrogenase [Cokeromyces recurvatus]
MGYGMAKNLALKHTQGPIYIHDLNPDAVSRIQHEFPTLHFKSLQRPSDVAECAATVVTMLPEASHVSSIYHDTSFLSAIDADTRLIDASTIDAETARDLSSTIMSRYPGALVFDTPVSGGILGAQNGTLTFMVGSPSQTAFETIQPLLAMMGTKVIYCGPNGSGQIAKVCNNMLLAVEMVGVSEAMRLGTQLGMDPHLLASVINNSTGRCWTSDSYNPYPGVLSNVPASRDYQGGFSNRLMAKDLRLAMKAADSCHQRPILSTKASEIYQSLASKKDFENLDFSSVLKVNI